jgi:hypothetical protein
VTPLATAAATVEQQLATLQQQVQALLFAQSNGQPAPPQQTAPGGFKTCINLRDYVAPDTGVDATAAIMRAMQDAGVRGNPSTVLAPSGIYIHGPLFIPAAGVILQGEGLMGEFPEDCRCTIFQSRDAADTGAAMAVDSSLMKVPHEWARGSAIRNIAFDVSQAGRFTQAAPPPVLSLRGVSNPPEFREIVVYGNIGTAYEITCDPVLPGVISENILFRNCWVYGGSQAKGGFTSRMPTAPLVHVRGSDNIQFHGGLMAFGFASFPPPVADDLTDMPAFLFESALTLDGSSIAVGVGGGIYGTAITNMPVSVRVGVALFNGEIFGPAGLNFRDLIIENFNKAFQLGVGSAVGKLGFSLPANMTISGCQIAGGSAWYGPNPHRLITDRTWGGRYDIQFMGMDGDVTFGANTSGAVCTVGRNPWGGNPQGLDQSGGKNTFDYQFKA